MWLNSLQGTPSLKFRVFLKFPAILWRVLDRLGQGWLTGGAVRDAILGKITNDFDIATPVSFDRFQRVFPTLWVKAILPDYGCIKLQVDALSIDVTMYRKEGVYKDHRRPSRVYATTRLHDAFRRDVTMNALYYDPRSQLLIDSVSGVSDLLQQGWVRAIRGQDSLVEDYLRILRVVRFTFQCGLELEPNTLNAVRQCAPYVRDIQPDRCRAELVRCLRSASIGEVVSRLTTTGILAALMGEDPKIDMIRQIKPVLACFSAQSLENFLFIVGLLYGRDLPVEVRMSRLKAVTILVPVSRKTRVRLKQAYTRLDFPHKPLSNFRPSEMIQAVLKTLHSVP